MRNSSRDTFTEAERVATNKVCTFTVRIIQSVKEKGGGWRKEILDVLLRRIDLLAGGVFGNLIKGKNSCFCQQNRFNHDQKHRKRLQTTGRVQRSSMDSKEKYMKVTRIAVQA